MCQMDMKCEFMKGPLDEEVYVTQPVDFVKQGQESKVYKLDKALHELKHAPNV